MDDFVGFFDASSPADSGLGTESGAESSGTDSMAIPRSGPGLNRTRDDLNADSRAERVIDRAPEAGFVGCGTDTPVELVEDLV